MQNVNPWKSWSKHFSEIRRNEVEHWIVSNLTFLHESTPVEKWMAISSLINLFCLKFPTANLMKEELCSIFPQILQYVIFFLFFATLLINSFF
jgi:hypothetical protein